jgi:hypothetical protein
MNKKTVNLKKLSAALTAFKLKEPVTYGNDFEFFLFDVKQNKMVSAIPVLKHDKHDPIDLGDGIHLYYDNINLETSFPPYNNKKEMFERFQTVFSRIQKYIGPNYRLIPKAAHHFDDESLQDPIAQQIGCSVSYNAWDVKIDSPKEFGSNLRTTGAHFHIGNKKFENFDTLIDSVRLMDIFLGVPSVIFNPDKTEPERRMLYGTPSNHRPCSWGGFEYRPLSSGILRSKKVTELCHDLINFTLKQVEDGKAKDIIKSINVDEVKAAIKNCDIPLAKKILKQVNFPTSLMKRVTAKYDMDFYKSWAVKV